MTSIELLTQLGLPSAFVGMVLIALIFKQSHPQVSVAAAVMAVVLVGVFGFVQLAEGVSGKDIGIQVSPEGVYAVSADGPTALSISASRGKAVQTYAIEKPSKDGFETRLHNLGWKLATECATQTETTPHFWSTNRVHAGQTQKLGSSKYGLLKLYAERFTGDGDAVVTLILDGQGAPLPKRIEIRNKGLAVQSFEEIPEFYVAVREADFQASPPWAAFNVFSLQ